jgi:hypothetical protein
MTGIDFSFFRLLPDFSQAKSDKMTDSEYFYNGGICLHPKEKYLQITNSAINIAFDDSYKVELIDCAENVLLDITSKVFMVEFQDNNGIFQIAFEILPINQNFYQKTYLRFTHLNSNLVLYSNGFIISDEYEKQTFRLDYKSYGIYKGTNYVLADFYQSIRLFGYFDGIQEKKDSKLYTEINGKIRKSRVIQSFESTYNIDWIDTFVYERLAVALENNLVYLNGVRIENLEDLKAGQRKGKSNLFEANFKVQFDENDTYEDSFQIAPQLQIVSYLPNAIYLPDQIVVDFAEVVVIFNKNVELLSNNAVLLKDGVFFSNLNFVSLDTQRIEAPYTFTNDTGVFTIQIPAEMLRTENGDFNPEYNLNFTVQNADFDDNDFNNLDFFTNE